MIDSDGWLDWTIRHPGPSAKLYPERNQMLGWACHSAEGWLAGILATLDNPNRAASWCFTNALDGMVYQHYPIWASCWASGNKKANTQLIGVESEGMAGTPLNEAQVANMVLLVREWEMATGRIPQRTEPRTIWEHNEVALWITPNAGPTACPSHRYDPFFAILEDEMADPRIDELAKALTGMTDTAAQLARLQEWNVNGNSLLDGYTAEQQKLAAHEANHPGGGTEVILEHKHIPGGVEG